MMVHVFNVSYSKFIKSVFMTWIYDVNLWCDLIMWIFYMNLLFKFVTTWIYDENLCEFAILIYDVNL